MSNRRKSLCWQQAAFSALFVAVALFALAAWNPMAEAQVLYGSLIGNVADVTGAIVSSAQVVVLNTGTGVQRTAVTNSQGIYTIPDLQAGTYDVTITAPTFGTFKSNGIIVSSNRITRVDARLTAASTTQRVVVTGAPPVLQTDRADVNYEIAPVQLAQLPTTSSEGRNFESLYRFVPGVTPPQEQNSIAGNPERAQAFNANGISWVNNSTRIDGATNTYPWLPYLIAYIPPQDAIASVNVATNSFTAEQGTAGGSVINVTIKSGTNQFHGSSWEYNSIQQFNANSFFNTKKSPKNIYNEYGVDVGGPIIKDKLFFFADWDRTTRREAIAGNATIPTPQLVGGDFVGFTDGNGNQVQIYDPATGSADGTGRLTFQQEYGTMAIPGGHLDPAAQKMLSFLPAVNNCASPCTNVANDYFGSGTFAYTLDRIDAKINYNPNENNTLFGRYSIGPEDVSDPAELGAAGGGTFDGGQEGNATARIQNVGLGFTHTFTPNLLLDMNAGFARQRMGAQGPDYGTNFGLDTLGIPGTNGPSIEQSGQPGFFFTGSAASGFGSGGGSSSGTFTNLGNANSASPFLFRDNQYVGNANLSWNKGRHTMRFGGEYTHSAINHFQPQATSNSNLTPRGSFIFTGGLTADNGGTSPTTVYNIIADFLLGLPQNSGKTLQTLDPNAVRWSSFAFYAQDQWQVTPKLTLTYGARYEFYPFATRDHEGVFRFDPSLGPTNNIVVGGVGGNPTNTGEDVGWGMIVPRAGIAYRVTDRTVIRVGAGLTVDPENFRTMRDTYGAVSAINPSGANAYTNSSCLTANDVSASGCPVTGIAPIVTPDFSSGFLTLPTNASTNTLPKHFRRGYISSWNAAVEQGLGAGVTLNLGYVGSSAVRQVTSLNINAAPPGGGTAGRALFASLGETADINSTFPFRGANYNALQTQLTRVVSKGTQMGVIYTWSKAIDYNDNSTYNGLVFAYPTYWSRNRAKAGFDRTNNLQWWTVSQSPFGSNGRWMHSGIGSKILGGWTLDTALSKLSGTPFSVNDSGNFLNAPGNTQVADQVKPVVGIYSTEARGNASTTGLRTYFDTSAFAEVGPNPSINGGGPRFGTSSRNELRGPGLFDLDAALQRSFPIWESVQLVFRIEGFNVTNTPAFNNPQANISSANFGYITSVASNTGGRTLNLVGRIDF